MSNPTNVFLGGRKHPPFAMGGVAFSLCMSLLAFTPSSIYAGTNQNTFTSLQQQKQTVTGVVKDASGVPVIGASVLVNGAAAAVTDVDGKFSLSALPGTVLQVSYVGYKTQSVPVKAGVMNYDVTLQEDNQSLNEVVVVGYGVQKKVNLTGSVSSVKSDALEMRPVTDASQSLQGLVPGLMVSNSNSGRPGATAALSLRGQGNLSGAGHPYVLVDGVEMSLADVNQNDI